MERAFIYGDLIFETIKVVDAKPQLINYHYKRLTHSAQLLKFLLPNNFSLNVFTKQLTDALGVLNKSEALANQYRLRYTLYRKSDGFYLPHNNQTNYFTDIFLFKPKPINTALKTGIYRQLHKSIGFLSNIKSGNALVYTMASIWAKENNLDDALILNEYGRIIEATSSNLFWVKNGTTYTVPLSEGCVNGVYRMHILNTQEVTEKICTLNDLSLADEIFITNALYGKQLIKLEHN